MPVWTRFINRVGIRIWEVRADSTPLIKAQRMKKQVSVARWTATDIYLATTGFRVSVTHEPTTQTISDCRRTYVDLRMIRPKHHIILHAMLLSDLAPHLVKEVVQNGLQRLQLQQRSDKSPGETWGYLTHKCTKKAAVIWPSRSLLCWSHANLICHH